MLNDMMREGEDRITKLIEMNMALGGAGGDSPATRGQAANSPTALVSHKENDKQDDSFTKLIDMKTQRKEDGTRRSEWGSPATRGQAANSPTALVSHRGDDQQDDAFCPNPPTGPTRVRRTRSEILGPLPRGLQQGDPI